MLFGDVEAMMTRYIVRSPEILFTIGMFGIMLMLSAVFALPILLPSGERAAFVGIHYLYPLLGVAVWGVLALIGQRKSLARTFFIALPCYAAIQWICFNIKLWVPHINPLQFDAMYWRIDRIFQPFIDTLNAAHQAADWLLPLNSNFYMIGFIGMFYVSFCFHAIMTPEKFRTVFLSALFFQGLGTLAYIPFPALGPFIYEAGLNSTMTAAQSGMLDFHRQITANGPEWLAINGPANLTAGLAAMPSLHAGGSFLFFLLAWKYARVLVPLFLILTLYILTAAITTRWHYLIDLPVGMAIAWASIKLAEMYTRADSDAVSLPSVHHEPALA